jgi:hypothetical protein
MNLNRVSKEQNGTEEKCYFTFFGNPVEDLLIALSVGLFVSSLKLDKNYV